MRVTIGSDTVNVEGTFNINDSLSNQRKKIIMLNESKDKINEGCYAFRFGELNETRIDTIKPEDKNALHQTLKSILSNCYPMSYVINSSIFEGNVFELYGLNIPVHAIDNYREKTKGYKKEPFIGNQIQPVSNSGLASNVAVAGVNNISNENEDSIEKILDDFTKMEETLASLKTRLINIQKYDSRNITNIQSINNNEVEEEMYRKVA